MVEYRAREARIRLKEVLDKVDSGEDVVLRRFKREYIIKRCNQEDNSNTTTSATSEFEKVSQ